ncbi:MAG: DSD1 family PLP-dependent enzyme [Sphaerobacter sp.]|nr:DSD1 family PLP-dependent enzyme [Sphaerobacter sp.]
MTLFSNEIVGKPLDEVDTPALLIDAGALERNIARIAAYLADKPARLRPHAKTHKSPIIAHMQLAAGAVGITCAKLGEAEALVEGGIRDILIANQIVGPAKIARLVRLARYADLAVAVDDFENAQQISDAAEAAGTTVRVLVEVNIGMDRCGVEPGQPAVELALRVAELPGLRFFGLQGYEGHLVGVPERAERERRVRAAMEQLIETRRMIEAAGLPVAAVSGGGTGTFDITSTIEGFDEIQAGSYVFMDAWYRRVEGPDTAFEPALFLWSTIVSRPAPDRAVGDIGLKTATPEHGLPTAFGISGVETLSLSEEHVKLRVEGEARSLRPGDKIRFVPGHVCTTVNLHDCYVVVRDGVVEAVWPVAARGHST